MALDIAASLVVAPALLFLDEPTTGLDPYSRIQVWQAVRRLVAQGMTAVVAPPALTAASHAAARRPRVLRTRSPWRGGRCSHQA
jgi:ABC-2 type transport system ATP-binding protein